MKNMTQNKKPFKIILAAAMILLFLSPFLIKSKGFVFWLVEHDQEKLTEMANAIIESGEEEPDHSWYFSDVDYHDSTHMVEFTTSYWGIAPSGVRKGFYYSPENIPLGYNYGGEVLSFLPYEAGWLWEEENGNNTMYTERIADHWFWFEFRD